MDLLWAQFKEIWWLPPLAALNIFMFWINPGWSRWINFACSAALVLFLAVVGFAMFDSYQSGCYGAAREVEFQQGMTICPGQSARVSIGIPQVSFHDASSVTITMPTARDGESSCGMAGEVWVEKGTTCHARPSERVPVE